MVSLCDNVTLIKLDDCVNGLPESFAFFAASVVVSVCACFPGDSEITVDYDAGGALRFGNTPVANGKVYIGKQVTFTS